MPSSSIRKVAPGVSDGYTLNYEFNFLSPLAFFTRLARRSGPPQRLRTSHSERAKHVIESKPLVTSNHPLELKEVPKVTAPGVILVFEEHLRAINSMAISISGRRN